MRPTSKSNLRSKRPTYLESPRNQKSFETHSTSPGKYSTIVSKYSMSKNAHNDKLLTEALEKHGPSLVYNFKFKNIMQNPYETQPDQDQSIRLPTLKSPKAKNRESIGKVILGTTESKSPGNRPPTNSTAQLKVRITKFLHPTIEQGYNQAMEKFETEIYSFKQKHNQQRERINEVLPLTEADMIQEGINSLMSKNIKKTFKKRTYDIKDETPSPPRSNIATNSQSTKALTTKLTILTGKNYLKEEPSDVYGLPRLDLGSPKGIQNTHLRTGSTTRANMQKSPLRFDESPKHLSAMESSNTPKRSPGLRSPLTRFGNPEGFSPMVRMNSTSSVSSEYGPVVKSPMAISNKAKGRTRFVNIVKKLVKKMVMINLTIEEIVSNKVFPSVAYEHEGALEFFKQVKQGDYNAVEYMLNDNKYLVYDYDPMKLTGLHWAAKRGYSKILRLLLQRGADPDARDASGRTALLVAVKGGHLVCVKLLLWFKANPLLRSDGNNLPIDYTKDEMIQRALHKGYKMHMLLELCSPRRFKMRWEDMDKREFEVKESEIR